MIQSEEEAISYSPNNSGGGFPLVLLIPGLGGSRDQWAFVAPRLESEGIRVAYGPKVSSDRSDSGYGGIAHTARLLCDDLRAHSVSAVHLVAHSVGTFVAIEMASQDPDLVTGMTLVNGGLTTIGRFLERPLTTTIRHPLASTFAMYLFGLVSVPLPARARGSAVGNELLAQILL